jgi:putative membrane protein insertion efficiency factor
MKPVLIKSIEIYQRTLSPDHGLLAARYPYGFCRHYPSCSEYTKLAIIHQPLLKAIGLSTKRIISCNPFVAPRVDMSCLTKETL